MQQQLSRCRQHHQQGLVHCSRLLTTSLLARHKLQSINGPSRLSSGCTSIAANAAGGSSCSSWNGDGHAGQVRKPGKRTTAYALGNDATEKAPERRVRQKQNSSRNSSSGPTRPVTGTEQRPGTGDSIPSHGTTTERRHHYKNTKKSSSSSSNRDRGRGRVQGISRQPLAWQSRSSTTSAAAAAAGHQDTDVDNSNEDSTSYSSSSSRKASTSSNMNANPVQPAAAAPPPPLQQHSRARHKADLGSALSSNSSRRHSGTQQQQQHHQQQQQQQQQLEHQQLQQQHHRGWQQQQQQHRQQHSDAAAALQNIKYKSFMELQQLVHAHGATASLTDLMAMFSRLKVVSWNNPAEKAALLDQLWAALEPKLQKSANPRHCAEAMLTASRLQYAPAGLYTECLAAVVAKLQPSAGADWPSSAQVLARVLANCIYAVGTAPSLQSRQQCKDTVEQQLLPVFNRCLHAASSQAVSNTVYAAALLGLKSLDLQQLLAKVPKEALKGASSQELSNILWAAGMLGLPPSVQQLQLLLRSLTQKLGSADPQHITSTLWGVANLAMRVTEAQLQQLAAAVVSKGGDARTASSTLHSAAKMGHQLPQQQVDRLLALIVPEDKTADISNIFPQSISSGLWAVAAMKRTVNSQQLKQLLHIHVQQLHHPETSLQCMSNTLWAAANLQANISTAALEAIFDEFKARMITAFEQHGSIPETQAISNALWSAASLYPPFLPRQLLQDPTAVNFIVEHLVPRMKLQEVSNIILACALLGYNELSIVQPLIARAAEMVPGASSSTSSGTTGSDTSHHSSFRDDSITLAGDGGISSSSSSRSTAGIRSPDSSSKTSSKRSSNASDSDLQAWCNICWGAAVLDAQPMVPRLLAMAQDCARLWSSMGSEDKVQLWQLHLWMQDSACHGAGLTELFTEEQLQECRTAWVWLVATKAKVSFTQEQVFNAVQQVPILQEAVLEARTSDQMFSADIMATGPDGQPVILEVDGPYHYRRPDGALTGPTCFRNRALAARGYTVVTVPWWEWQRVSNADLAVKVQYLQTAVQQALELQQQQQQHEQALRLEQSTEEQLQQQSE